MNPFYFCSMCERWHGPLIGTPERFAALEALLVYGDCTTAAFRLGLNERTFNRRLERLRLANDMNTVQLSFHRGWETREPVAA